MEYSQKFVKLHIGASPIVCTDEHPFFVNDEWVAAKDLKQGDSLFTFSGAKLRIDSVYQFTTYTATAVYDLEVAGNSNYYVSASGVLVHNCDDIWNITAHTVTVEHHNWSKIFGLAKVTLEDVTPIIQHVAKNSEWVVTKQLHGVGEGLIKTGVYKGQTIWIEGTRFYDGTIRMVNAGVK